MCHSTKRTHFLFADFLMDRISIQKLMFFAEAFANGFVLEKRTHFGGSFGRDGALELAGSIDRV